MLEAVGRGARRRLLLAMDEATPARAVARECVRGERALASLARLGLAGEPIAEARGRLVAFAAREGTAALEVGSAPEPVLRGLGRRPRRSLPVPIHGQRHLLAGWSRLLSEERERWRAREESFPEAPLLCDLAWYACDGARTVDDIARLVWLETGRHEPEFIAEFFARTATLGLSDWSGEQEAASSPVARDTATR